MLTSASFVIEFIKGRPALEAEVRKLLDHPYRAPEVMIGDVADHVTKVMAMFVTPEERAGLSRMEGNGSVNWNEVTRPFQKRPQRCLRCIIYRDDYEDSGGSINCIPMASDCIPVEHLRHEWRYIDEVMTEVKVGCTKPPPGWRCTRGFHETGPCAAVPVERLEPLPSHAQGTRCHGCGSIRGTVDATGLCISCRAVKSMLADDVPSLKPFVGNITFEQFVGGLEKSAANIATLGVDSDSNSFDGDLYEEHKDQLRWLLEQAAIKLRDGLQLRELAKGLLDSLPRCTNHPETPATKAKYRGNGRYCDECGEGIADYPRANHIRKLTKYLAEKT